MYIIVSNEIFIMYTLYLFYFYGSLLFLSFLWEDVDMFRVLIYSLKYLHVYIIPIY